MKTPLTEGGLLPRGILVVLNRPGAIDYPLSTTISWDRKSNVRGLWNLENEIDT